MVSRPLALILRGFQLFCIFIVLALSADQISMNNAPAIVNYDLFVAVVGMLSLAYLILATLNETYIIHRGIMLAVDAVNLLFVFCGAVATAALLGVHSCDNEGYIKSNTIARGSPKRCRESQASTAFLFFALIAWAVSFFFTFVDSRNSVGMRGVRSNPSMSQVSGV